MDDLLRKITNFADHAHGQQLRRYTGERYIVHPLRVMEICRQYNSDRPLAAAALLHDVLEDTRVTKAQLEDFLATVMEKDETLKTVTLVEELTDVFTKAAHPRLNRRTRRTLEVQRLSSVSAEAQTIKYADIIDNAIDITAHDPDFASVYLKESLTLLHAMTAGHSSLRTTAMAQVQECLNTLGKMRVN